MVVVTHQNIHPTLISCQYCLAFHKRTFKLIAIRLINHFELYPFAKSNISFHCFMFRDQLGHVCADGLVCLPSSNIIFWMFWAFKFFFGYRLCIPSFSNLNLILWLSLLPELMTMLLICLIQTTGITLRKCRFLSKPLIELLLIIAREVYRI